ncbi:MAG: hypothetical protein NT069_14260, partial [Planctomycetota bacterium]|nr:hypothetical protein [Planctomycetota bacterium]
FDSRVTSPQGPCGVQFVWRRSAGRLRGLLLDTGGNGSANGAEGCGTVASEVTAQEKSLLLALDFSALQRFQIMQHSRPLDRRSLHFQRKRAADTSSALTERALHTFFNNSSLPADRLRTAGV